MATGSTDRTGGTASSTATSRATGPSISVAQKIPCIACASTNVTLSGEQTINGVVCYETDRVLLKGQTNAAQNGPWLVSTGQWTRPPDWDHNGDVMEGTSIRVTRGTNAGLYIVTTTGAIVIDSTEVTLTLDGGTVGVLAANNGSDFSSRITTLNTLFGTGVSIVAAATVNLSDQTVMTGFAATITGSTGISAFTMDAEQVCLLIFSGAPLITVGANLVGNNNAANIQIEAGDMALLRKDSSGSIVRFTHLPVRDRGNSKWGAAVASASTFVIPEGVYGHATGTTTITDVDFGISINGRFAIVEFDSALQITHSAQLKCPGSANLAVTAGMVVMFIQDVGDTVTVVPLGSVPVTVIGVNEMWIDAGAFIPQITNGPSAGITGLTTNKQPNLTLDFDTTTQEFAVARWVPPKRWDGGTFTYRAYWTAASGSGTAGFLLEAVAVSNDDTLDVSYGTAVAVIDTLLTALDLHVSPDSTAVTPAGSPADADMVWLRIKRDVATDTLAVDAKLLGIVLIYTVNAGNDA